jgi:hypothetical protein
LIISPYSTPYYSNLPKTLSRSRQKKVSEAQKEFIPLSRYDDLSYAYFLDTRLTAEVGYFSSVIFYAFLVEAEPEVCPWSGSLVVV